MTTPYETLPADWHGSDIVEGLDILDKAELIDRPFRILGCVFNSNNEGISICYIDAEDAQRQQFTFLDSSTGVRAQIVKYLTDKGLDAGVSQEGEYIEFQLVAPRGLRKSEYDRPVRGANGQIVPGKKVPAVTYYLTTNGERGARGRANVAVAKSVPEKGATRTAK